MKKEQSKKHRFIQILRILSQIFFFSLFIYLLLGTHFTGEDYIGRVEIFFHFDPLLALTTFIASRAIFVTFALAAVTIIVTLVLGRVACGWVCPMGAVQQFFSFLFKKVKLLKPKKPKGKRTTWKYYILIFILVAAIFSLDLVGIMDPLSLLYRSFIIGVIPAFHFIFSSIIEIVYQLGWFSMGDTLVQSLESLTINPIYIQGFFIVALFAGIIILNIYRERFWCRYLCPLGAFLGVASNWNAFKLKIDPAKCIDCNLCT
ncbi:MAG: 4Fe-4S binding protein, partial [Candidatus Aminicenantaceae bacterium]